MTGRFAQLLNGYSVFTARERTTAALLATRLCALLNQFGERVARVDMLQQAQRMDENGQFRNLLNGYNETVECYRRNQELVADDFNLLDVMRLTGKEIRHSMVLGWLLDHDINKLGTHAQGNLEFRLFLNEFGFPVNYAECRYWVRREVTGDESIVDLEVGFRGRFLIHIENKIWASEGTDQTDREWSDLRRRAEGLNVPTADIYALFLTPHGAKPTNRNFRAITWGRIVRVLVRFAEQAKPPDVKLFAAHYARAVKRFIVMQDTSEENNVKRTLE